MKKLFIIGFIIVFFVLLFATVVMQSRSTEQTEIDQQIEQLATDDLEAPIEVPSQNPGDLSQVNPEESIVIANTLGLPYENDVFYIQYRLTNNQVRLFIFDKTNNGAITPSVQDQALSYIRARNINPETLDIVYGAPR